MISRIPHLDDTLLDTLNGLCGVAGGPIHSPTTCTPHIGLLGPWGMWVVVCGGEHLSTPDHSHPVRGPDVAHMASDRVQLPCSEQRYEHGISHPLIPRGTASAP